MNKHDKVNFSWDNSPEDYYKKRIESLQEQLENANRIIEMNKSYIDKLEKALAELTTKCAKLEKAFVQEAMRTVEV